MLVRSQQMHRIGIHYMETRQIYYIAAFFRGYVQREKVETTSAGAGPIMVEQ